MDYSDLNGRGVVPDRIHHVTQTDSGAPIDLVLGVLGGTGQQGQGLARRFAMAGAKVLLGSRDVERAEAVTAGLEDVDGRVRGVSNAEAAGADVVFVTVPYEGHAALLTELAELLAGRIVVDCVNPLGFDKQGAYALDVPEGSAAEQAAALLPGARVTAAFHHVSAKRLLVGSEEIVTDVIVVGDDLAAKDTVIDLICAIPGLRGLDGGSLRLARHVEALTAVLIAVNKRYKAHAGMRLTDVDEKRRQLAKSLDRIHPSSSDWS
ncbi:MAG: reduced coenzyme oxidoreductase [Frankiales bacterium]|nr:reduced coenzyme oxidoreductase [Frankiales bacterium]